MKKISLLFLLILSFFIHESAWAAENKFGIHILEPSDLDKAAGLVNSNGGDWGYVTVVIRDDDLNFDKWQDFMNSCREKHLIPLVRLATHLETGGPNWVKPKAEEAEKWANFLENLNWPVKDQYVIIFNEPNHTKEWGGVINPKEYSRVLLAFIEKIKLKNENFKVLNAGLDLAAPNSKTTMEAGKFLQEMNWEIPGIFDQLDGWASHSYPNHGYLGKPWDTGKTSVRGYEWEILTLKNQFKVKKDLPVFITETGWPANDSKIKNQKSKIKFYDWNTVSNYLKYAFESVWLKDIRVKAITPFVLNYPESLFSDFSWLDKEGNTYPQYETIKNLAKINWWPEQIQKITLSKIDLPPFILTNSSYKGRIIITNEGQSILGEKESFILKIIQKDREIHVSDLIPEKNFIKPKEKVWLDFEIKTGSKSGEFNFEWEALGPQKIKVVKPSILAKASLTFWEKILAKIKFW